ncbi:hypothetical protein [Pedobacter sp.]|uniref:hypothetical protein n=1 Tax=Pedobacter sp. TaxID=1411316 RepID=UPI002D7F1E55|nr:hypothetical protein [Pedobacter sp.]
MKSYFLGCRPGMVQTGYGANWVWCKLGMVQTGYGADWGMMLTGDGADWFYLCSILKVIGGK